MFAGQRTQFEQPGFRRIERGGIMHQRLPRSSQLVLCLARLNHCTVERRQRLCQQRMFGGDPVQLARRAAQHGERRIRSFPDMAQLFQIARQLLALLHIGAAFGEAGFLACHRFQRGQFGKMRDQQVLIGPRLIYLRPRSVQPLLRASPALPRSSHASNISTRIAIEQGPVATRIDETAIIVLAMQFHQRARHFAQQRHAHRLVIDEGLAAAIGLDPAADD